MNWYYGLNGETVGPVDENQMVELINQGTVVSNTLVWNDQMGDAWITVAESELNPYLGGNVQMGTASGQNMAVSEDVSFCSLCGNQFASTDLVEIGDMWSCAACKPMALRRIQQNTYSSAMYYAGFWIRVAAALIDGLIQGVALIAVVAAITGIVMATKSSPEVMTPFFYLFNILIQGCYSVLLIGKTGSTLGMKACGITVVNADGSSVSMAKAIGRFFANMLNGFTLNIGYIIVAFDSEKRALHDHICATRVIYKNR